GAWAGRRDHGALGGWSPDWAAPGVDGGARRRLGVVAGEALRSFAPLFGGACGDSGLGAVACDRYDPVFTEAAARRVAEPLAARGIEVPASDLTAVSFGAARAVPPSGGASA